MKKLNFEKENYFIIEDYAEEILEEYAEVELLTGYHFVEINPSFTELEIE